MTEIGKKKGIKVIIQNLKHTVVHPKAFLVLYYPFKVSRLLSAAELDIINLLQMINYCSKSLCQNFITQLLALITLNMQNQQAEVVNDF